MQKKLLLLSIFLFACNPPKSGPNEPKKSAGAPIIEKEPVRTGTGDSSLALSCLTKESYCAEANEQGDGESFKKNICANGNASNSACDREKLPVACSSSYTLCTATGSETKKYSYFLPAGKQCGGVAVNDVSCTGADPIPPVGNLSLSEELAALKKNIAEVKLNLEKASHPDKAKALETEIQRLADFSMPLVSRERICAETNSLFSFSADNFGLPSNPTITPFLDKALAALSLINTSVTCLERNRSILEAEKALKSIDSMPAKLVANNRLAQSYLISYRDGSEKNPGKLCYNYDMAQINIKEMKAAGEFNDMTALPYVKAFAAKVCSKDKLLSMVLESQEFIKSMALKLNDAGVSEKIAKTSQAIEQLKGKEGAAFELARKVYCATLKNQADPFLSSEKLSAKEKEWFSANSSFSYALFSCNQ